MQAKDFLFLAVGIGAVYALSKIGGVGKAAIDKLGSVGSALGSGLFDLFHPNQVGETLFYTVTFPNGARHAIPSSAVNSSGQFNYTQPPLTNTRWQLLTGKDGKRYAAPV